MHAGVAAALKSTRGDLNFSSHSRLIELQAPMAPGHARSSMIRRCGHSRAMTLTASISGLGRSQKAERDAVKFGGRQFENALAVQGEGSRAEGDITTKKTTDKKVRMCVLCADGDLDGK